MLKKVSKFLLLVLLSIFTALFILQFLAFIEFVEFKGKYKLTSLFANQIRNAAKLYHLYVPILLILSYVFYRAFVTSKNIIQYRKILKFTLFWAFIAQNIFPILPVAVLFIFFGLSTKDLFLLFTNPGSFPLNFLFFISIFVLLGTVFTFYLFRKKVDKKPLQNFGFQFTGGFVKEGLTGIFIGGLFISFGFLILYLTGNVEVESFGSNIFRQILYIAFFLVMAANEEIIFRGYILDTLLETGNKFKALLISSIIFAVFHAANPNITWISFINLIIAGFFLGISYIHVRNLWFPTMLHFAWNFFQGPIFGFGVSGMHFDGLVKQKTIGNSDFVTGGKFGLEGSVVATFLMILFIIGIHFYYQRQTKTIISHA